jgi:hypothetical protein
MSVDEPGSGSTWLGEVEARLRKEIRDEHLTLTASILKPELEGPAHLLFSTLESDELCFATPVVARGAGDVTLVGRTSLLGLVDLDATLTLELVNEEFTLRLCARLVDPEALSIPDSTFAVRGMSLSLSVGGVPPAVIGGVHGTIDVGSVENAGVSIALDGELEENFVLTGAISRIDLSRIAHELLGGRTLPEELPDVEFHDVKVSFTPATGAFSLRGTAHMDWDIGGTAVEAQIDLVLDRDVQQVPDGLPGAA